MNTASPRFLVPVAVGCALLIALPPAFAMDVLERIVSTQTTMIRHEASEYQRKVAEANARAYMAAQLRTYRHEKSAHVPTPKPGKTAKTDTSTPKPHKHAVTEKEPQGPATAEEKHEMKKHLPRYIAVDTPTDNRSAPGTKKDVMIWDTQNESLVGKNVYDVQAPPKLGSSARFDTYSAQYVGNGL
jgi:DNA replication initiation complex subunit (GINS family)